jgi:hypothetical protein
VAMSTAAVDDDTERWEGLIDGSQLIPI